MKKRLLEEEGIMFEEDSDKIRKEFFVESVETTKSSGVPEESKGVNSKEAAPEKASSTNKSKYFTNTVTEDRLKHEIVTLLQMRQAGKTC